MDPIRSQNVLGMVGVRRILPIHHHPLGCVVTSTFGCGRDVLAGARWVWARQGVLGESAPNGRLSVWPETRATGCCVRVMELEDDAPLRSDYIMQCDTPMHCLVPCALCLVPGATGKMRPPPPPPPKQAGGRRRKLDASARSSLGGASPTADVLRLYCHLPPPPGLIAKDLATRFSV